MFIFSFENSVMYASLNIFESFDTSCAYKLDDVIEIYHQKLEQQ